jgi:hypothetical protein
MSKPLSLVVTLLALIALSSLVSAQTTTCQSTFTAGSGDFAMQFCVTENGNIAQYATPLADEHILTGTIGEGYGICDVNDPGGQVEYYDYAGGGATANWETPTIDQPNGANTFPLTITRKTSGGVWKLVQTFSQSVADRAIKIKMDLHNLTGDNRAVNLVRFADINANGQATNNSLATPFSALAIRFNQVGIELRDAAHSPHETFVQRVPSGPSPCTPDANAVLSRFAGDGSLELNYNRTVPKNGSKTVTVLYRPI